MSALPNIAVVTRSYRGLAPRRRKVETWPAVARALPATGAETERALLLRWRDHHDIAAVHRLVGSHLHLVVSIAMEYRGHGLADEELMGEGHVGLMRAICRFDPDGGVRFSTYAALWVRAAMLGWILQTRSHERVY